MECKELTEIVEFECMGLGIIGSVEIYEHLLKLENLFEKSPIPQVTYYENKENIEKLIKAINSSNATAFNEFHEAVCIPKTKSSANPSDRQYKNKRTWT